MQISPEQLQICLNVLNDLALNREKLADLHEEEKVALMVAAGKLSRPNKVDLRAHYKQVAKEKKRSLVINDRKARAKTGIRSAREASVFSAPEEIKFIAHNPEELKTSTDRNCYVCKKLYHELHHFYDSMCKECGDYNYKKRFQLADMTGQVALITGSRLKIGYHATLMMLKAGARVIATTRFPHDSAQRFGREKDFHEWKDRLHIYGLDLRHTPSVEMFCSYIEKTYDRLDVLINNAAQTVRRPPGFYTHMMEVESLPYEALTKEAQELLRGHYNLTRDIKFVNHQKNLALGMSLDDEKALPVTWHTKDVGIGIASSAKLSQIPYGEDYHLEVDEVFPEGKLDADLQQVDLRRVNSWRLRIGEIQTPEMIEVQLVNAIAPFVLCNRLSKMMRRDYTGKKHIVNVSAMEGKFHRFKKEDRHPHTNMAKAALNMLTHTSASDLAKDGIFMNAVDTGWVTDEDPAHIVQEKQKIHDFEPPLDIVDGAARVCDPFFDGMLTGKHWCGKFLKDYFPIDW